MKKQKLTIDEVKHVAKLANLPLTEQELADLTSQLESIVEFISKLQVAPTKDVVPTSQVTHQINSFREDEINEVRVFSQEQALANAKESYNGFFKIPGIF